MTKMSVYNLLKLTVRTMIIVSIGQGKLKGQETKTDKGIPFYEFLGIPYAKPPIGNLRFQVSRILIKLVFLLSCTICRDS